MKEFLSRKTMRVFLCDDFISEVSTLILAYATTLTLTSNVTLVFFLLYCSNQRKECAYQNQYLVNSSFDINDVLDGAHLTATLTGGVIAKQSRRGSALTSCFLEM